MHYINKCEKNMVYVWSLNIFVCKTTIFHDAVYPWLTETETMRRETELHNHNVHFQSQSLRFCEFMASPGQSHNFVSCSVNSDCSLLMYDLEIRAVVCEQTRLNWPSYSNEDRSRCFHKEFVTHRGRKRESSFSGKTVELNS